MKITLSVIKADIGGFVGHSASHPAILKLAEKELAKAKRRGTLSDYHVTSVGDDLQLIMTHKKGENSKIIHKLAYDTFVKCTKKAKELGLYGAGQDLLKSTFSGNLKGMGPGVAEMEFEERPSEPVIIFMADKTEPGAWNLPLYKMFADPFSTAGLVIDPHMHDGFKFEIHDVIKHRKIILSSPEHIYDILALIGQTGRYVIKRVYRKDGLIAAVTSTTRLNLIAGKYVGKDDPVMVVRAQHGLPAVGEVLEPFSFPHLVAGWMRGSHHGPLMPCSVKDATPARFDGPPRVIGLGFQIKKAKLIGPRDMLGDKSFDRARWEALRAADYMRKHGPFEPHRLGADEMEYTTLPLVEKKFESKFKPIK
ncbi:MAG TPA: fructose 1,6-bisphosphatase [Candidatus Aenigmarchaeota archaeon]|nr:fructose 1,6-bisphosphatase [Candidatus Aenigmarchaeota archaeon]HEX32902.1 fructose 1,6-bisphosphatase [Candidatus Aenigmarchaeota archaeon]